jgi:hypothetical protein
MRHSITMLTLAGALLMLPGSMANATTSAHACRAACVPRITEQCGGRTGRALRQCRRPLLRACRATTPDLGCPSRADLAHALGDRILWFSTDSFVLLCADGSFAETPPRVVGSRPSPTPPDRTPIVSPGPWLVVVDGDGLAVDLGLGTGRDTQLSVTPTAAGFVVNGTLVTDADATAACSADAAPTPTDPPPASPEPLPASSPPPPSTDPVPAPAGDRPVVRVPPLPQVPETPLLPPR